MVNVLVERELKDRAIPSSFAFKRDFWGWSQAVTA
jgi:hypothetical protein